MKPSETTDLVSSKEFEGVGSPGSTDDMRLLWLSGFVGDARDKLFILAELIGLEKLRWCLLFLWLPGPENELAEFCDGDRSCCRKIGDAGE